MPQLDGGMYCLLLFSSSALFTVVGSATYSICTVLEYWIGQWGVEMWNGYRDPFCWDRTLPLYSMESVQFYWLCFWRMQKKESRRTMRNWVAGGWILQNCGIIFIYQPCPNVRYMPTSCLVLFVVTLVLLRRTITFRHVGTWMLNRNIGHSFFRNKWRTSTSTGHF